MLERFTERARRAVVLAIEEARSRRHEAVGPEHLLIGILQVGGDFAVHSLEQLGVSPETVRAEVERVLSETPGVATSGEPTFSPELKAVLEVVLTVKRRRTVDPIFCCSRCWQTSIRRSAESCTRPEPTWPRHRGSLYG
jgi:ATP-dependent Clp protease ATP-binding subunit ClpA